MKEVKAFIQPFKLSAVTKALQNIPGFPGMTVSDCRGFGREVEDFVDYIPKVRIEIMLGDEMADRVVEAIAKAAHTGNPGDGKVFVCDLERVVRIKTFEEGDGAV